MIVENEKKKKMKKTIEKDNEINYMEEETKEDREINFLMEKKDMAKQRMLICWSVLLDDTRTFCIDGELDPTFEELFMKETPFLICFNIFTLNGTK